MIEIKPITPLDMVSRWEDILPMLDSAMPMSLGRFQSIDILVLLVQNPNTYQAWLITDDHTIIAIAITQIWQYPRRRCLTLFCLAGTPKTMKLWYPQLFDILKDYARRVGADQVEVQGRRGWERVFGCEPRSTLLIEDIPQTPPESPQVMFREVKGGLH